MGTMIHDAIGVTTFNKTRIDLAYVQATFLGLHVTPPVESFTNGYWSLLIVPDGSKEGWPDSEMGDRQRKQFHKWLRAQANADGSNSYWAVTVAYGELECPVITHDAGRRIGRKTYRP